MAFAAVERLIAFRYLRARRDEGFHLGDRRLLADRHHAWRRHADRRRCPVMNGFRVEMLRRCRASAANSASRAAATARRHADLLAACGVPGVWRDAAAEASHGRAGDACAAWSCAACSPTIRARTPLRRPIEGPAEARPLSRLCRAETTSHRLGHVEGFGTILGRDRPPPWPISLIKVGDNLQLVSPVEVATPLGVMPRSVQARVAAVFCAGMYDYDANFVYAPLPDVQRLLNFGDKVTGIEVFVADDASLAAARRQLSQVVGTQAWVFDWWQANIGFFAAIQGQTNVMFIVLTMIVLVAAFNIVSSLVMLVRTKTADIAILRTMGATRGAIMRVFLLDGMAIGGIGTLLGVVLGLAFARNIEAIRQWLQRTFDIVLFDETLYLLAELPSRIEWARSSSSPSWRWSFALLASLYPAARAARLDPVEGLRRE
jgi:lipoprotein-releasing system permease protein